MARTEPLCAQIEAETDKERRNALKANLPIKIPNAWMDDEAARNNKNAHPNGTMTLDFDGLDEDPRDLWERIKDKVMALNPIEVEISASGKGMHIWVLVPQGLTLKESIPFYAKRLGLEKFADKAVSDPARAIYIVPERDKRQKGSSISSRTGPGSAKAPGEAQFPHLLPRHPILGDCQGTTEAQSRHHS